MDHAARDWAARLTLLTSLITIGCASPYHSDRGALIGGLAGAGAGALVGNAVGNPVAGAAIGGGLGAVTGAVVGNEMDQVEARNRAMIEEKLQRRLGPGAVTPEEVVMMARGGVAEDLIVNHIRANGMARPLQAADLVYLQQQGVTPGVIRAMQEPPRVAQAQPLVMAAPPPGGVIVEEHYYHDPYWYPGYYRPCYAYPPPPPRVGFGVTVRGH